MSAPRVQAEMKVVGQTFTPTHVWRWKACLPERHGQPCRLLAYGGLNTCLLEFSDGWKVVTSRWAVRRLAGSSATDSDPD